MSHDLTLDEITAEAVDAWRRVQGMEPCDGGKNGFQEGKWLGVSGRCGDHCLNACNALALLTGARFAGGDWEIEPERSCHDQGCAQALCALWLGLDQEAAEEAPNTIDMSKGGES